jgi:gamma-glutamyl hydrolase
MRSTRAIALLAGAALSGPLAAAQGAGVDTQQQPVIGILSVPIDSTSEPCITSSRAQTPGASCFTSFYPKWIEAAGARAVVIPYNANATMLDRLFNAVNGILFTGGGAELFLNQTYVQTAMYLFDKVVASAAGPNPVALHGTCMGFQTLAIVASRNDSVLCRNCYSAENISWPLTLTPGALDAPVFKEMPAWMVDTFTTRNATLNLHHDGVPPEAVLENPALARLLTMVATNVDRVGAPFASMWAGAGGLPITGTQFHP